MIDRVRKQLIREADSEYVVVWRDICDKAQKNLKAKGLLGKRQLMWLAGGSGAKDAHSLGHVVICLTCCSQVKGH